MADMLTNTVGAMLFIMIFTVLSAGGATALTKLPMAHPSEKESLLFICENGKVYPSEVKESAEAIFQNNKNLNLGDVTTNSDFVMTLKPAGGSVVLTFETKPDSGERSDEVTSGASRFERRLRTADPAKQFVFFSVSPDSIGAFNVARKAALDQGFEVGWNPRGKDRPLILNLSGGGGGGIAVNPQ
jgi:hypothetical protein